jgi:formylglycine-generating enzyme required for sulfatase activity
MNCIDWSQADRYCKWKGKRLPTTEEWSHAASGKDGRRYPWGNEAPSAKRLNACGGECVEMAKRELGAEWNAMFDGSDGHEGTAPVGSYPDGASPSGALDMTGNVLEWTETLSSKDLGDTSDRRTGAWPRVGIGGAWDSNDEALVRAGGEMVVTTLRPTVRDNNLGFRCAK